MSQNVRVLRCTPEDVFAALGDGWLYPSWVVGASRMREVDETWPRHRNQAMAILHVMREPDAEVGESDGVVWRRLIEAAIANG